MLPRRKPPKSGIARNPERVRSDKHLKWVRGHVCAVARTPAARERPCEGKMEPHHVRLDTQGGMALKPGDQWTVPLCSGHHAELDSPNNGQRTFEARYGVNLKRIAEDLARRSPHLRKLARDEQLTEMVP